MHWTRVIIGTIIAAAVGFFIHVYYGQGIAIQYVQKVAEQGRLDNVIRQYPTWLIVIAAITSLLPALGKFLFYILIQNKLPGNNKIIKGIVFGVLLLLAGGHLVRMPLMGLVCANPFDVVVVQSLEKWAMYPILGIIFAYLAPDKIIPEND